MHNGHSQGGLALAAERLSVLHLSQCRGGGDGTAALLVAGAARDSLAAVSGESGVRGHGTRSGGMSDGVSKKNVPTMGGLLIVASFDLSALMWAQWNPLVTLTLLSMLALCLLGFYDDYSG